MNRQIRKKIARVFVLASLAIVILFSFQNCGDVGLRNLPGVNALPSQITADSTSVLPLPNSQAQETRIVFFVDMSVSMAHGLCPKDNAADSLDKTEARRISCEGSKLGIAIGEGSDPNADRLKLMEKWIDNLQANSAHPENIQYLIVPFNGLKGTPPADQSFLKFTDAVTAKASVSILTDWQTKSIKFYQDMANHQKIIESDGELPSNGPLNLSTTTPADRLAAIQQVMKNEAERLARLQTQTQFEFVILSDGVPKPRASHIKKAIRAMWDFNSWYSCSQSCGTMADNLIDGYIQANETWNCSSKPKGTGGRDFYCFEEKFNVIVNKDSPSEHQEGLNMSGLDFLEKAREFWGDWKANSPNTLTLMVSDLKKSIEDSATSHLRLSLVWINPLRLSPEVMTDKENWMLRMESTGITERFSAVANSDRLPFSLAATGDNLESYRIGSMMIWNPTVRVDSKGQLRLDSDGDGLFDDDEIRLSFDPKNPRTNGRCLDSLTAKGLCSATITCDPKLDQDMDGLNECEEIILGTNPQDFDSDGDGVPDGIEYLMGSNPLVSDLDRDDNKDGALNIKNLVAGVHPNVKLNTLSDLMKISFELIFKRFVDLGPNKPKSSEYSLKVNNIPALSPKISTAEKVYSKRSHVAVSELPFYLTGGSHPAAQSKTVLLVRVDNQMHNTDVHWAYLLLDLSSANSKIDIQLDQIHYFDSLDPQKAPK